MRPVWIAVLLLAVSCTDRSLPIESGLPGSGGGAVVDMARAGGGEGAACTSACDCTAGLACRQGSCGTSMLGPVFCCGSGSCPTGSFCQTATGMFNQCGGVADMSGDAGLGALCSFVECSMSGNICKQLGCGHCGASGHCEM
jgi:hypothetical protein